jgi:Putative Ig domain
VLRLASHPAIAERLRSVAATWPRAAVLSVMLLALMAAAIPAASGSARPQVTLITDSVGAALLYDATAQRIFSRGLNADLELRTCRRLASPSCAAAGESAPPSALDLIRSRGRSIGQNVVIGVGYNDDPYVYAHGIDEVLAELQAAGVRHVFWMTLRAARPVYLQSNAEIYAVAKNHPEMTVLDWDTYARGHSGWFGADGLHLKSAGAEAMARFMHDGVLAVLLAPPPVPPPPPIGVTLDFPQATVTAGFSANLHASGGKAPYRFAVRGLPAALHLHPNGTITGVPPSGSWTLQVTVTDAKGRAATQPIELDVSG